jgi:beta-lactamase class A
VATTLFWLWWNPPVWQYDRRVKKLVDEAVAAVMKKFAALHLRAEELAVTLADLSDQHAPSWADHRGDAPTYPASVVKLFYLVAAHRQMEDGKISDTAELRRALRDMIVDSGNEATGYVVDVLTGTTSGPELPPTELRAWHELGYSDINANRKTWNEGPYGRDMQAVQQFVPARNSLTTNATARLLVEIAAGRCVSAERSSQMLDLLRRNFNDPKSTDYQAREFIGAGLPPSARLWSKCGDMSQARHDAALIELAGGARLVLVIFTTRPDEKAIIPEIARLIVNGYGLFDRRSNVTLGESRIIPELLK